MSMKEIFQPLRDAMESHNFVMSDVFDVVALCQSQGQWDLAQALTLHARDFSAEQEAKNLPFGPGRLLAEMYWRTYFDETASKTTNTFHYVGGEEPLARTFVDYITGSLLMDSAAQQSGFPVIIPAGDDAAH